MGSHFGEQCVHGAHGCARARRGGGPGEEAGLQLQGLGPWPWTLTGHEDMSHLAGGMEASQLRDHGAGLIRFVCWKDPGCIYRKNQLLEVKERRQGE